MIPGVLAQLSIVAEEVPPEGEEQVVFLSGFEGADGSTGPMVDESTFEHAMTFNGNVELDTAQQKFGASSLESVISIGTDDYISVPNHTCFHFGDGDFTIEGFARSASLTGPHNFVSLGTSPNFSFRALLTESFSNDVLQFTHSVDGTTIVNSTSSTISLSVNTWYHWAFVRNNLGPGDDTLYFFIDGVGFGTAALNQDALFPSTDDFIINGRGDGFEGHRGHLDEVRVLNYAAYTANFTPPAAPFDRPGASGELTGTAALTFTIAGDLDIDSGELSGSTGLTFTIAGDLDIPLVLDGIANLTAAWSADRDLLSAFASGSKYTDDGGGSISSLKDQSGAARHLNAGNNPNLTTAGPQSRSCLNFNGTDDILSGTAISNFITATAGYFYAVVIVDTVGTNDASTFYGNDAVLADDGGFMALALRNTGPPLTAVAGNWDGSSDAANAAAITAGNVHVLEWRHEGGNLYIRVDGTGEQSVASGSTSSLTSNLIMGRSYGGAAQHADIKVFEAAAFSAPPTLSERDAIVANAIAHYG